jgi:DNA replication protein DnaC
MKDGTLLVLREDLKALKLSAMARDIEIHLRRAKETGIGYDEFLLELTAVELQVRAENRLNRRIREAKFPLIKPVETFDLNAVPDLDIRLFRELAGCGYIQERKNIEAEPARPIWPPPLG